PHADRERSCRSRRQSPGGTPHRDLGSSLRRSVALTRRIKRPPDATARALRPRKGPCRLAVTSSFFLGRYFSSFSRGWTLSQVISGPLTGAAHRTALMITRPISGFLYVG